MTWTLTAPNLSPYETEEAPAPVDRPDYKALVPPDMWQSTLMAESQNRDFDDSGNPITSPRGAKYKAQVMPATAAKPGYGIRPAADDSPEEWNRVGHEKMGALLHRFGNDRDKAAASYNWGEGNVLKAIAKHGSGWRDALPDETRKYIAKVNAPKKGWTLTAPEEQAQDDVPAPGWTITAPEAKSESSSPDPSLGWMDYAPFADPGKPTDDHSDQISRSKGRALTEGKDFRPQYSPGEEDQAAMQAQTRAAQKFRTDVAGKVGIALEEWGKGNPFTALAVFWNTLPSAVAANFTENNPIIGKLREAEHEQNQIRDAIVQSGDYDRMRDTLTRAGGEDVEGQLKKWLNTRTFKEWKLSKPHDEAQGMAAMAKALGEAIQKDPVAVGKDMLNQIAASPYEAFLGPVGIARTGAAALKAGERTAQAARLAEDIAVNTVGAVPGIAATRFAETGSTAGTMSEAALQGPMMGALHAARVGLTQGAKGVEAVADVVTGKPKPLEGGVKPEGPDPEVAHHEGMVETVDIALSRMAREEGTTHTADSTKDVVAKIEDRMARGETAAEATFNELEAIGMRPEQASRMAQEVGTSPREQRVAREEQARTEYDQMTPEQLDVARREAVDHNRNVDIEAVRQQFGDTQAERYAKMSQRKQDRWWGKHATQEMARYADENGRPISAIDDAKNAKIEAAQRALDEGEGTGRGVQDPNAPESPEAPARTYADMEGNPRSAKQVESFLPDEADQATRLDVTRRVNEVAALYAKGDAKGAREALGKLMKDKDDANMRDRRKKQSQLADRVRDVDYVRERILKARRTGEIDHTGASLALWLLSKNPRLANDLAISVKKRGQARGEYDALDRLITIFEGNNEHTTAHEVLHHTERMMPQHIQRGIQAEWAKRLTDFQNFGAGQVSEVAARAVHDVLLSNAGDVAAQKRVHQMIRDGEVPRDFYQLTNPSEFWAVNGARILHDRALATHGWVKDAKQWLREFVQKIKQLFGLDSDAPVIRGLNNLLKSTGERQSRYMLMEHGGQFAQPAHFDTPAFQKWFGDSKIVDSGGSPLRVFHHTYGDFDKFKPGGPRPTLSGKAIWMTLEPDANKAPFAHQRTEALLQGKGTDKYGIAISEADAKLALMTDTVRQKYDPGERGFDALEEKRLAQIEARARVEQARRSEGMGGVAGKNSMPVYASIQKPKIFEGRERDKINYMDPDTLAKLKAEGYDGAISRNDDGSIREIVAFDPKQVKSAVGNKGTYTGSNVLGDLDLAPGKKKGAAQPKSAPAGAVTGSAAIRQMLTDAVATGKLPADAVKLAEWLLAKNPNLLEGGLSAKLIPGLHMQGAAGFYDSVVRMVGLAQNVTGYKGISTDTIVHELFHHAERMMPANLQKQIALEWDRRWKRALRDAEFGGNDIVAQYLRDAKAGVMGDNNARKRAMDALVSGMVPIGRFYQFFNPSEFWTMNASSMVEARSKMPEGFKTEAKEFMRQLGDRMAHMLGEESDAPINAAMRALMETTGAFKSPEMLREVARNLLNQPAGPPPSFLKEAYGGIVKPAAIAGAGAAGAALATQGYEGDEANESREGQAAKYVAVMAGVLATRAGWRKLLNATVDHRFRAQRVFNKVQGDNAANELKLKQMEFAWKKLVPSEKRREAITHYLQGDQTIVLTRAEKALADEAEKFFAVTGQKAQSMGILPEKLLEDYVTQLWRGINKNDPFWTNIATTLGHRNLSTSPGMSPHSRYSMKRVIPSYKDGMAVGMIPKTLDIAEIARIYGSNIHRSMVNKNLLSDLERTRVPGTNYKLIMKHTEEASVKDIVRATAVASKQGLFVETVDPVTGLLTDEAAKKELNDMAIRRAPSGYIQIGHPQLGGYRVHPDIAPQMKYLFDVSGQGAIGAVVNALNAASVASKRMVFSLSMFHHMSLLQALLGSGINVFSKKNPLRAVLPDIESVKRFVAPAKQSGSLADLDWSQLLIGGAGSAGRAMRGDPQFKKIMNDLVRGGLEVANRPAEGDVTAMNNAMHMIEDRVPVIGTGVKGARWVLEASENLLWDKLHPTFKVAVAMSKYETMLKKGMDPKVAASEAAKFANDIMGGQDWFAIANDVTNKYGRSLAMALNSPTGRKLSQILMLAPDWTVSTARSFIGADLPGLVGWKGVKGVIGDARSNMHRAYILRSLLLYLTIGEGLNRAMSGHSLFENEDPTMLDAGDGTKIQMSKHFMEPIHWALNPRQQALNKLGYIPGEIAKQLLGKEYLRADGMAPPMDTTAAGRMKHALRSTLPIWVQTMQQKGLTPALSGMVGIPIYGSTEEQAVEQARERAERSLPDKVRATRDKARKEGKDPDKAEAELRKRASPDQAEKRVRKSRERSREREEAMRQERSLK